MTRENSLVTAQWVEDHLDDPKVVLVEVDEDLRARRQALLVPLEELRDGEQTGALRPVHAVVAVSVLPVHARPLLAASWPYLSNGPSGENLRPNVARARTGPWRARAGRNAATMGATPPWSPA